MSLRLISQVLFLSLLFTPLLPSCVKTEKGILLSQELELLASYPLAVDDPSGLSRSHMEDHLFTVSDNSGNIYLIDKRGVVKQVIHAGGDDLEGIEFVEETATIYMLEERLKKVISIDLNGNALDTFWLDIPVQNPNDGPEGIAYNPQKQHFYIVNEKNPSRLYVYNTRFELLEEYPLNFALDYSSVDYTEKGNHLWILSDESKLLARCNLKGEPDKLFYTDVPKGEGVVVDITAERIYIVCDESRKLYIFRLPV